MKKKIDKNLADIIEVGFRQGFNTALEMASEIEEGGGFIDGEVMRKIMEEGIAKTRKQWEKI